MQPTAHLLILLNQKIEKEENRGDLKNILKMAARTTAVSRPAAMLLFTVLIVGMVAAAAAAATKHVVGGTTTGWTIPPNTTFYSEWSSSQTFAVGDSLVFNFPTGAHNVIKVPKSDYDACTTQNQIGATLSNGPATVTIPSGGQHYYLCGVGGHCSAGQKVSITVKGSSSAEPAPAPVSGGPAPAGSTGSTTPSTPAAAPGPSSPAPQGSNSAAATLTGGCLVAFFSLVFASLI